MTTLVAPREHSLKEIVDQSHLIISAEYQGIKKTLREKKGSESYYNYYHHYLLKKEFVNTLPKNIHIPKDIYVFDHYDEKTLNEHQLSPAGMMGIGLGPYWDFYKREVSTLESGMVKILFLVYEVKKINSSGNYFKYTQSFSYEDLEQSNIIKTFVKNKPLINELNADEILNDLIKKDSNKWGGSPELKDLLEVIKSEDPKKPSSRVIKITGTHPNQMIDIFWKNLYGKPLNHKDHYFVKFYSPLKKEHTKNTEWTTGFIALNSNAEVQSIFVNYIYNWSWGEKKQQIKLGLTSHPDEPLKVLIKLFNEDQKKEYILKVHLVHFIAQNTKNNIIYQFNPKSNQESLISIGFGTDSAYLNKIELNKELNLFKQGSQEKLESLPNGEYFLWAVLDNIESAKVKIKIK